MRVLESGTKPGHVLWRGECGACRTKFEARRDELKNIQPETQRDKAFAHADCSFCGARAGAAVILYQTHDVAPDSDPVTDTEIVVQARAAVKEYYAALTAREHGGVAQDRAFKKIEHVLGMSWHQ